MAKELFYQEANIIDVLKHLVERTEMGESYTTSGRTIGNIHGPDQTYSVAIIVTVDEDACGRDLTMPFIDDDLIRNGKEIVRAPKDFFGKGKMLDSDSLEFPEDDEY